MQSGSPRSRPAHSRGLPPDLEHWARQTSMAIQLGQGRPPISEAAVPGQGVPPLEGPTQLVWSALAGVVLAAMTVMFAWILFMA